MKKNVVLKYSHYTAALTRALKDSNLRIHCNMDDDGMIYVCNGYFAVKLTGDEYDALVRPVTQRDAGNWVLHENGSTTPDPINLADTMNDAAKNAAHTVTAAPMFFDVSKGKKSRLPQLVAYYSETGDFVAAFNSNYAAIISPALERKSSGGKSPMVVYDAAGAAAIILPVRIDDKPQIVRTVRAWFIDNADGEQAKADKSAEKLRRDYNELMKSAQAIEDENKDLRRQLETLRQCYAKAHADFEEQRRQVEDLQTVLTAKNEQIETLVDRMNAHPDPQPQESAADVQPQDKAAALAEKLAALPRVTATVKGAQTAAPVVWLTGEADAHKDKIEEMGGKWSGKRSAWYFKIA